MREPDRFDTRDTSNKIRLGKLEGSALAFVICTGMTCVTVFAVVVLNIFF